MQVALPHPQTVVRQDGVLALDAMALIYLPADADALDIEAARLLQQEIRQAGGPLLPISRAIRPAAEHIITISTPAHAGVDLPDNPEAYAVTITPSGATLVGATPQARLWAVQTVRQALRLHGGVLPAMQISDAPAMRYRGVLLDASRRKVPTVEALKELVDVLSLLKLNMLQLQIEHTFQFRRHPRIGEGCGSFSCEDILELDAYCRQRGVALVPMLQSFGHMRNILMLPEYRHLAENTELQWSLCPTDPASLQFLDELYEEFLPCFSSGLVNIGSDETVDLGRKGGRSNAAIAEKGKGRVYLEYIQAVHKLLSEKYGKQVMCWGDVVLHYPELVPELPSDLIVLNWWYEGKERYEQVDVFAASGLPQMVCPGTSTWNTLFPRVNVSWQNVGNFVRDGKGVGALGLLNTDWGDGGHYNLLGNSLYSYAHGAEASWAAAPMTREEFEQTLGPVLFGAPGAAVVQAIRDLGSACDQEGIVGGNFSRTQLFLFATPIEDTGLRETPPAAVDNVETVAAQASTVFHAAAAQSRLPWAVRDMAWAADAVAFAARRMRFFTDLIALAEGTGDVDALLATGRQLLAEFAPLVDAFQSRWYAANRHAEIEVVLSRFAHARSALQTAVAWLEANHDALAAGTQVALPEIGWFRWPWKDDCGSLWTADVIAEANAAMA